MKAFLIIIVLLFLFGFFGHHAHHWHGFFLRMRGGWLFVGFCVVLVLAIAGKGRKNGN